MNEYIKRKDAEDYIKNFGKGAISDGLKTLDPVDDIVLLAKGIDMIPAADVAEVKHGEWLTTENDTEKGQKFTCSVCKKIAYYPQPTRDKSWVKHCGYTRCPYCGAKMDKKEEVQRNDR